jgi:hypothetical protein
MATVTDQRPAVKSDVERLHQLGYAQELLRKMGGFSNFAVSFTIISILSGCLTLYGTAMNTGGPVEMSIGWPIVGIMVTIVGLAMAELASTTGRRSSREKTLLRGAGLRAGSTCWVRWRSPPASIMAWPFLPRPF